MREVEALWIAGPSWKDLGTKAKETKMRTNKGMRWLDNEKGVALVGDTERKPIFRAFSFLGIS